LSAVRETLADFQALDTQPYGINPGSAESHQKFIDELDLTFDLLVDEGLAVAKAYDVLKPEGGIQRTVVIVGKNGRIIFRAQGAPPPAELLSAISAADDA
jgi:thioredoxin-dependent peroxiredoxin